LLYGFICFSSRFKCAKAYLPAHNFDAPLKLISKPTNIRKSGWVHFALRVMLIAVLANDAKIVLLIVECIAVDVIDKVSARSV